MALFGFVNPYKLLDDLLSLQGFFRRCITRKDQNFRCLDSGQCDLTPGPKPSCAACRYKKCLQVGMSQNSKQNHIDILHLHSKNIALTNRYIYTLRRKFCFRIFNYAQLIKIWLAGNLASKKIYIANIMIMTRSLLSKTVTWAISIEKLYSLCHIFDVVTGLDICDLVISMSIV